MTRDEEREILAAARGGDRRALEEAFGRIFERYRERVFAVCLRLTGNAADAEDAVQECFVDVLRGLPGFRGESQVFTWVYRIAIRAASRVRARRGTAVELAAEPAAAEREPLEEKEALARLLAELARLPLEHRAVLALCAIEGRDTKRVAEILGIPAGTVWSRLHRARELLRERLAQRGIGREPGSDRAPPPPLRS